MVGLRCLCVLLFAGAVAACGEAEHPSGVATSPPTPAATATPTPAPPGASDAAGAAVTHYFDALRRNDCPTAFALLADPLLSRVGSAESLCRGQTPNNQNANTRIGPATGDAAGGQVTISVAVTKVDGSVHNDNVIVILRGGAWKISDILINPGTDGSGGQVNMDTVISTIQQQYSGQARGAGLTLTCPRSGSFPATQGDSFQCSFTDSSGRRGTLTVSVTSARGDYTWSIP